MGGSTYSFFFTPKTRYKTMDKRLAEIEARLEWMDENYHGCDWCCGGGDEERRELLEERGKLVEAIKVSTRTPQKYVCDKCEEETNELFEPPKGGEVCEYCYKKELEQRNYRDMQ
jgi:hypothetical protein